MSVKIRNNQKSIIKSPDDSIIEDKTRLLQIINEAGHEIGEDSYWILYNQNKVLIGKDCQNLLNDEQEIEFDILKNIRFFGIKGELYIWKYNDKLRWRLRIDNEGEDVNIYEEEHYRWNIKGEKNSDKNRELILHSSLTPYSLSEKFKVYNYFSYDKDGLIKFYDARLVDFIDRQEV